jgi:hypothetical protein
LLKKLKVYFGSNEITVGKSTKHFSAFVFATTENSRVQPVQSANARKTACAFFIYQSLVHC